MRRGLIVFAILLVMASTGHAEVKQLHIALGSGYPPFYSFDENKQPSGICIDIVNLVAQAMNITVQYDSYPWKRMLSYGKEGKVDAVMPLFKTAEREQFLSFPEVGLVDEDNSFFISPSNPLNYSGKLVEVANLKVGVMDNYSYGKEFDSMDFPNKTVAKSAEQLIMLVQNKRIDLGIGNSKVITYFAKKMSATDKIRFLSPPVTVNPLFIGFSKKRVDQDFVARFNKQLQKLKATQTYAEITRDYGL